MLDNWQSHVASENQWRVLRHERYQVVSVDITGFWRLRLKGWVGQHFYSLAQRALPAVVFGGRVVAHALVSKQTCVTADAATFSIYACHDPHDKQALVPATSLGEIQAETSYLLYRNRWSVEHPPLAAKQMLGLHRQFVFASASCFRLPEVSLIAGATLTDVAAVMPQVPSAFWDRTPQATPGCLRRLLDFAR